VEALAVVDAKACEDLDGPQVLDVLGDRALPHPVGDLHDRGDEDPVSFVLGTAADELAVHLQVIEWQVLEVVERAEAGAEVIERELASQLGEPLGEGGGVGEVRDGSRLGDLEREAFRRYAGIANSAR
jgi:hypothetical protein